MKHIALLAILLAGCQTIDIPKPTINIPPITIPTAGTPDKPATPIDVGCKCDLTKPLAVPLAQHGNESQVNIWLQNNGAPECGGTGMPIDVRFRLERPSGNSWSYAPFAKAGLVTYKDGKLTARCGEFEGQMYHCYYMSAHNQGTHMEGVKIVSGQAVERNGLTFVYYQARDKQ
jgi:hypothetical protein